MTVDTLDIIPSHPRAELTQVFESLLAKYAGFLRSVIAGACPPALGIQTSDIEQDARLRLWRALHRERQFAEPAAYIYRIAVTSTLDAVRRVVARREEQLAEPEHDFGEPGREAPRFEAMSTDPMHAPDAIAERRQVMVHLFDALAALAENRRRAVELHLQGLSLAEIAALLGWTESKARNLVYRGLADLRAELRERGIDYD